MLKESKEVRRTLKFHEWLTFQRYPDVYAGPKSFFQQPLQEISQVFVNKNGEIFMVEKGVVSALCHRVLCQKQAIKTPVGLDFGDLSSLQFGITTQTKEQKNKNTGVVTAKMQEHMFVLNCTSRFLWIMSHIQKTIVNSSNVSAPLKCLFQFEIKLNTQTGQNTTLLYSSSFYGGILLTSNAGLHAFISYVPSEELFRRVRKNNRVDTFRFLIPSTKCSLLLTTNET